MLQAFDTLCSMGHWISGRPMPAFYGITRSSKPGMKPNRLPPKDKSDPLER
jgi:hypothetical protein